MAKKKTESDIEDTNNEIQAEESADLSGLIPMHRDGKQIHAHPTVIDEHKKNGWKLA